MFNEKFLRITGIAKNETFIPYDKSFSNSVFKHFEGQVIDVIVQPHEEPKSEEQLGYFFGVIIKMVCTKTEMFRGWSEKEIYSYFCQQYLFDEKVMHLNGGSQEIVIPIIKTLSQLNKKQTAVFIQKVIEFLSENGIYVPEPTHVAKIAK